MLQDCRPWENLQPETENNFKVWKLKCKFRSQLAEFLNSWLFFGCHPNCFADTKMEALRPSTHNEKTPDRLSTKKKPRNQMQESIITQHRKSVTARSLESVKRQTFEINTSRIETFQTCSRCVCVSLVDMRLHVQERGWVEKMRWKSTSKPRFCAWRAGFPSFRWAKMFLNSRFLSVFGKISSNERRRRLERSLGLKEERGWSVKEARGSDALPKKRSNLTLKKKNHKQNPKNQNPKQKPWKP